MQRVHLAVKRVERSHYPSLSRRVPCHSVRPAKHVSVSDDADRSIGAHGEDFVAADINHTHLAHDDAGVGHVDRPVRADSDIVEQHRAARLEVDLAERSASESIEGAQHVDVSYPQCVAMDGESFWRVEVNAILAADSEQLSCSQIARVQLDDVTVVVLLRTGAVHDGDEVQVLTRRVAHRFGPIESLYDADSMRRSGYRIYGIMAVDLCVAQ